MQEKPLIVCFVKTIYNNDIGSKKKLINFQFAQVPLKRVNSVENVIFFYVGRMLMAGDVELKEIIMESLRNLIGTCQDLEPLKNNLGNFLRILCNIYQVCVEKAFIFLV